MRPFVILRHPEPGEPSAAQVASGRYRKRKVAWKGLTIRVENEAGTFRRGKDAARPWETLMAFAYGEIARTEGVDGDPVDVFLGPYLEDAAFVYVIHQRKVGAWDEYDEDKCMIGFASEADAVAAFRASYSDPRFLGPVTTLTVEDFIRKVRATRGAPAMVKSRPVMVFARPGGA